MYRVNPNVSDFKYIMKYRRYNIDIISLYIRVVTALTALGTLNDGTACVQSARMRPQTPEEIMPHYQGAFDGLQEQIQLGEHCVAALQHIR